MLVALICRIINRTSWSFCVIESQELSFQLLFLSSAMPTLSYFLLFLNFSSHIASGDSSHSISSPFLIIYPLSVFLLSTLTGDCQLIARNYLGQNQAHNNDESTPRQKFKANCLVFLFAAARSSRACSFSNPLQRGTCPSFSLCSDIWITKLWKMIVQKPWGSEFSHITIFLSPILHIFDPPLGLDVDDSVERERRAARTK